MSNRAYLLVTLNPRAALDTASVMIRRIHDTGLGFVPAYGWREGSRELLVECAPDDVDVLRREISERDAVRGRASDELVRGAQDIRRLAADEALRFLAENKTEEKQRAAAFILPRTRSVIQLIEWVEEDQGRARAALGVEYGGPNAPREDVVSLLMRVVERAGECVAVWNASADHPCPAAAGPNMPHRCVATDPEQHHKSITDHRCACGSSISAAEVPFELAERIGLTYEPGRPGELPGTLVDVRAFNPVDAEHHPVGYLLVVGEGLPTPVRHELWMGDEFMWLKRDLARRNEVLARADDYGVAPGAELRLALFDQYGHRVCHGVTVAEPGFGLPGGRATVRGVATR